MLDPLSLIMRWLHLASMATLVGGVIYARFVLVSAITPLSRDTAATVDETAAAAFRPLVLVAVAGLIVSGIYNLLTNPGHSVKYHVLLGIKLLLVLHVFAVAFLVVKPGNQRRPRMLTGTFVSALIILAISAYLRRIF